MPMLILVVVAVENMAEMDITMILLVPILLEQADAVVVPLKLQVAKHGVQALRLLLVKAEMLPATLVVAVEAAGMEVAEPTTMILILMDVGVEVALDMSIHLQQLKTILTDAYSILLIISQMLKPFQEINHLNHQQEKMKLDTQTMDFVESQI